MVTLAACGFSFSGAAGGLWRRIYRRLWLAGGVSCRRRDAVLLFPFLVWLLPESLRFLLRDAPPYACRGHRACCLEWACAAGERGPKTAASRAARGGGGAVSPWLYAPTLLILGDLLCQPDLLYFMIGWLPSLLLEEVAWRWW